MDNKLSRSNSLNRVISSTDAFQLLVRNATNRSAVETSCTDEMPTNLNGLCTQSQSERLEAVRACIADKPDPFGLAEKIAGICRPTISNIKRS